MRCDGQLHTTFNAGHRIEHLLVAAGADPNADASATPLHGAAGSVVDALIDAGADLETAGGSIDPAGQRDLLWLRP